MLIAVAAMRMQSNVPIRLIAMTFLNASRLAAESYVPSLPTVRCDQPMPAEFTNTRSGPMSLAISTALMMSSVLVTSTLQNAPPISSASALPLSSCKSATKTLAPLAASIRAAAAPMPEAPPVTIALTPLISMRGRYAANPRLADSAAK